MSPCWSLLVQRVNCRSSIRTFELCVMMRNLGRLGRGGIGCRGIGCRDGGLEVSVLQNDSNLLLLLGPKRSKEESAGNQQNRKVPSSGIRINL
jgi:hypothetical protein